MRTHTNADALLKSKWYCEDCGMEHSGVNPPNECDKCGAVAFENCLDLVGEGRPLPEGACPKPKPRPRPKQRLMGVPPSAHARPALR